MSEQDEIEKDSAAEGRVDDMAGSDGDLGFLGADVSVEDKAYGSDFPLIQWVNGTPQGKTQGEDSIAYTGGWFMSADQGIEPPPGFKAHTMVTTDGEEVAGFAKRDLTFSPIRTRRCWVVDPGDGKLVQRFAHNDYEAAEMLGRPRGTAHVLVGIEGVEDAVMLSFRGLTAKSVLGQGRDRGIIPEYSNKIVRAAKRIARNAGRKNKTYPLCAFKLTVGGDRDTGGTPKFTEVGSGANKAKITLPIWLDEPKKILTAADINRLYVGNELFAVYQDIHRDADDWRAAWDADVLSRFASRSPGSVSAPGTDEKKPLPGDQEIPF